MTVQQSELGGYRLVRLLAVGGMAEVYHAQAAQRPAGEPADVALKRLLPTLRADEGHIQHFVAEAKLTARLRHPNLVRTFRLLKAGPDYLMVQELVQGQTLAALLAARVAAGRPLAPAAALYVADQLLRALAYVHAAGPQAEGGIVHRDVNPSNVLVSAAGEVKLTDFGVAEGEGLQSGEAGALRGTVEYMSPEQVLGLPLDHRSDLFSVGVVLWELLANRRLFAAASDAERLHLVRDAQVPDLAGLGVFVPGARVVRKALFADRALRFQSAAELARAVQVAAQRAGWTLSPKSLVAELGASA